MAAESSASEIRVHLPCVQRERGRKKKETTMRLRFFAVRNRVVVDFRRSAISRVGELSKIPLPLLFGRSCSGWDRNEDEERERFGKAPASRYRKFRRIVMQHLQRGCK